MYKYLSSCSLQRTGALTEHFYSKSADMAFRQTPAEKASRGGKREENEAPGREEGEKLR